MAVLHDQLQEPPHFETTEECAKLTAQIAALRDEVRTLSKRGQDLTMVFTDKIRVLQGEIQAQNEIKARFATVASQQRRIAELAAREKELARQYEALERGLYLCDLFTKTKVGLLTERINSKFQSVSFRLFVEQVNGGIREDCEVMIPGPSGSMVPFAFANHGARVNAGLEIIDTLSKHWNLTMPIFIDNAESVTRLLPAESQVIRLVVSATDNALRLELNQEREDENHGN
ncbi:MAG: hypothetical protein DDT38_01409 [Firmicutes bacterium]|nr:hypothetical protein [candidate division NPL-UPA2 bacterium]